MLAWRNLWRHRRRTLITLSSIAFGFGLSVFFIGLGDGGHNSMIRNAIKLGEGHITIQHAGYQAAPANHKYLSDGNAVLKQLEGLSIPADLQPRVSLQVLASTANNSLGVALEGLNPVSDRKVEEFSNKIISGQWLDENKNEARLKKLRGIIIGDGLAKKLKAKVGSKIVLMAGKKGGDTQAQLARVKGIFDFGIDEVDDYLILTDIRFAQQFLKGEGADLSLNPITRIAVFLDQQAQSGIATGSELIKWREKINAAISSNDIAVLDWQVMMPDLVQYIAVDDAGNYVFLSLIMIMVVIGIVNTVLMSVLERTREFGLLRALGLSRNYLMGLVFIESVLMSLLAVLSGWIVGGAFHAYFSTYGLDFSQLMEGGTSIAGAHMDPVVYTELSFDRVWQLTSLIFATTLATGIYPAVKAARVTPVAALK